MNPQWWAGLFYLLNKVGLSRAERSRTEELERRWRAFAWIVYLIGLPAWVIIFVGERNWMVAAIELGAAPSMVMGLIIALRGRGSEPRWLDIIAVIAIIVGISYSLHDFGGITAFTQWLELSLVIGFLTGTYLLAKKVPFGYVGFMLMNVSNALLMVVEGYPVLVVQQLISLCFVIDAYHVQRRKKRSQERRHT